MPQSKKSKVTDESETCDFDFICDYVSNEDSEMIGKILENYIPSEFEVDLTKLTELILGNAELSLVMRNCLEDDEPNDMDIDPENSGLLSISTVIGLQKHRNDPSVIQMINSLNKLMTKTPNGGEIMKVVENPANNIGLIINERIINDPRLTSQVLETLFEDIKTFRTSDKTLEYTHYCILMSCSKVQDSNEIDFYHKEMKFVYESFPMNSLFKIDSETNIEKIDKTTTITTCGYRAFVIFPSQEVDQFLNCMKQ